MGAYSFSVPPIHFLEKGIVTDSSRLKIKRRRRRRIGALGIRLLHLFLQISVFQFLLMRFFSTAVIVGHPGPIAPDQRIRFCSTQLLWIGL